MLTFLRKIASKARSYNGYWHTIYRRFGRWCDAGVFEKLHKHFDDAGEISALFVDATVVRSHACAVGAPKKTAVKTMRHLVEVAAVLRRNFMRRRVMTFSRCVSP